MNGIRKFFVVLFALASLVCLTRAVSAQGIEEYNGSVISFNGPRVETGFFTLRINGQTSNDQAAQFLSTLQNSGENDLLRAIQGQNLGSFSVGNQLGRTINVVRESTDTDGRQRIFVVFERWTQFAEVRGGYRSLDYPFGVIELYMDPRTGKGEGTYIAAARIRFNADRRTNQQQVEIENFATFPAKLTNVTLRRGRG